MPPRHARGASCIGALLLQRQAITESQLEAAIVEQHRTGRRLAQVLVELGATTQAVLTDTLTEQLRAQGTRSKTSSGANRQAVQERT
jgi:hypothetical protein